MPWPIVKSGPTKGQKRARNEKTGRIRKKHVFKTKGKK
jgi:hypothetical protein